MPKLKVFRTAIGFHDAYVAAPSRKAALQAWGSDKDLFARGIAEEVTDPTLIKEPLAQPGTVFKRSRGTADEQIAALSIDGLPKSTARVPKLAKAVKPRPDRTALDEVERAVAQTAERQARDVEKLDDEIAGLQAKRAALTARHRSQTAKLEKQRASRAAAYDRAMDKWRAA